MWQLTTILLTVSVTTDCFNLADRPAALLGGGGSCGGVTFAEVAAALDWLPGITG